MEGGTTETPRLTFMNFLGYPRKVPDARTVWYFKQRIARNLEMEKKFWEEMRTQLEMCRISVRKGQSKEPVIIELGRRRSRRVLMQIRDNRIRLHMGVNDKNCFKHCPI